MAGEAKRAWLKVSEDFQIPEYTAAQVRALRDADRRRYRADIFRFCGSVVVLIFAIRMFIDYTAANAGSTLKPYIWLLPYITFGVFFIGVCLMIGAILFAFRRTY